MDQPSSVSVFRLKIAISQTEIREIRIVEAIRTVANTSESSESLSVVVDAIDKRRHYAWRSYFLSDWHETFARARLAREVKSVLRVDLLGPEPLKNIIRRSSRRLQKPSAELRQLLAKRRELLAKLERVSSGLVSRTLVAPPLSAELQAVMERIGGIESRCAVDENALVKARSNLHRLTRMGARLDQIRETARRLNAELSRESAHMAKHAVAYAKAAAHDRRSRSLVRTIASMIHATPWCPYCGAATMEDAVIDHIYPVSLGGLSIPENLVVCCAQCNGRKSDRPLLVFLEASGFSVDDVVRRLRALGKHI